MQVHDIHLSSGIDGIIQRRHIDGMLSVHGFQSGSET